LAALFTIEKESNTVPFGRTARTLTESPTTSTESVWKTLNADRMSGSVLVTSYR